MWLEGFIYLARFVFFFEVIDFAQLIDTGTKLFSSIPGLRTMVNHPPANVLSDEERYDPRKRDPQYAHAETSPLWELVSPFCYAFC